MKTVGKIVLGIVIAVTLLVGGCVAVVGGVASDVDKEIEKQQTEHAITPAEFKSIKQGDTLKSIIAKYGKPEDRQTTESGGYKSTLIYYNVEGGDLGDMYQLSFDGNGVLDGKSAW